MNIHTNNIMDMVIDLIEEDVKADRVDTDQDQESSDEDRNTSVVQAEPEKFVEDYTIQDPYWRWEKIKDWAVRINGYTAEQKKFYSAMVPKMQEMRGVVDSQSGWTLLVESKSDAIKIETKKSIRELIMMRAFGTIDHPAQDIFRTIQYFPLRKEWDVNNDINRTEKVVGANAYIQYIKTVKKFVISARDFVTNYIVNEEADGTIILTVTSEGVDYNIPPVAGVVRAYTALSGWILKPHPGDPKKTDVSMMVEVDLKAGIPDFAMRQALKDQGYQIYKLRAVIPKWKKLFPGDKP